MRQLVLDRLPDTGGKIAIEGKDYRYLVQVLRLSSGDALSVRFQDGSLREMVVEAVDRGARRIIARELGRSKGIASSETPAFTPIASNQRALGSAEGFAPPIILFQWVIKGPKMDQVMRQATEAGVSLIIPVLGERSLIRAGESSGGEKKARWDRIAREAMQQSGSAVLTTVHESVYPKDIASIWENFSAGKNAHAFVLTEGPLARKSLHEYLGSGSALVALASGPEGGMSQSELALLAEAGFSAVHFRTNILRAETAALYGIAAVQIVLTELQTWQLRESSF